MEQISPLKKLEMIKDYEYTRSKKSYAFKEYGYIAYSVDSPGLLHLRDIYVSPKYRNTGTAKKFWKEFLNFILTISEIEVIIGGVQLGLDNSDHVLKVVKGSGAIKTRVDKEKNYVHFRMTRQEGEAWLKMNTQMTP